VTGSQRRLGAKQRVPFVWADQTKAEKLFVLSVDGKQQKYSIDKIKKFKDFQTDDD